jgi:ribose transport system permease protein
METPPAPGGLRRLYTRTSSMGTTLSLAIALIAICVVWSILSPYFFTLNNIMNVLMFASIIAIRASGLTVSMILGGMDISQNAVGAVTALLCALASNAGWPWYLVLGMVILLALLMGAINATLVSVFKIAAIITTLGTMQIFRGAAWLIKDATVMVKDPVILELGRGRLFDTIPYITIVAIVVLFIIWWVLNFTSFGRKVYMVGGNERASFLSGINVSRVKFVSFIISGLTAGIAGFLAAGQVGAALPQAGAGTEMNTIAAVILGGISLSGGKGKLAGTILGILILQTVYNGLQLLQINAYWQMVVSGSVLLLAVLIDVVRSGALKKQ